MALPKMFVQIGADTGQFESGMSSVIDATNQLQSKMKLTIDASGRLRDRFGQTVRVTEKLENAMRAAGVDVELVSDAMADLMANSARTRDALQNVANTTKRASVVAGQAVNDNSRFSRSIQNASFQLGDFATQVGAGTSASIALGQQLPQLLGGFGVLGAVLGAVVAVGVPLVRVLSNLDGESKELQNSLGPLAPVMQNIGAAFVAVKETAQEAIVAILNNLGRLTTIAGTIATLMAGRFVAGMVAARVATFSLAGAVGAVNATLSLMRGLLIRTGIGALAVAVGELIWQFIDLNSELRTFLAGLGLIAAQNLNQVDERIATVEAQINSLNRAIQEGPAQGATQSMIARYSQELVQAQQELDELMRKRLEFQAAANQDLPTFTVEGVFGRKRGEETDTESAANQERLQTQLDQIRESQMTEQELLMTHLAQKKAILDEALAAELVARQEHASLTQSLEQETANKIVAIEDAKRATMLGQTASLFGALANLAQAGGKKTASIAKAFGIAEAIINTYVGATNALRTVPFPANFAAAAAVIANGLASVATIASVNTNSGGGSASGAAGSATAPPPVAQRPLDVFIQGVGPGDLISGGQLSSLFDKLVEEAGDRGIRPVFAT